MKAIKENWKLVLIVAAGIIAVIFMCIFVGTMVILGDLDNCYRTMRIWFLLYR